MTRHGLAAVVRQSFLVVRRDPAPLVVTLTMPLVLMALLRGSSRNTLAVEGIGGTGASHVVPAMAVFFALFYTGMVGALFLREHLWGTWDLLRLSALPRGDIYVGKLVVPTVAVFVDTAALHVGGAWLYGAAIADALPTVLVVSFALGVFVASLGLFLVAFARSMPQMNAVSMVTTILLAGLSGALTPIETLPDVVQAAAALSPIHRALSCLRAALEGQPTLDGGLLAVGALVGWSMLLTGVAVVRLARSPDREVR